MLSTNIRLAPIVHLSTSVSIGGSACGDIDFGEASHEHRDFTSPCAVGGCRVPGAGRQLLGPAARAATCQQGRNPMIVSGVLPH